METKQIVKLGIGVVFMALAFIWPKQEVNFSDLLFALFIIIAVDNL